jgi:hypothetical protein
MLKPATWDGSPICIVATTVLLVSMSFLIVGAASLYCSCDTTRTTAAGGRAAPETAKAAEALAATYECICNYLGALETNALAIVYHTLRNPKYLEISHQYDPPVRALL